MINRKLTLVALSAFFIGALIGVVATYNVAMDIWRNALVVYMESSAREHEKIALTAFKALPPEASVYAQDQLARDLTSKYSVQLISTDMYYRTLAMARAREGISLRLLGKNERAEERLDEAVVLLKKINQDMSKDALVAGLLKFKQSPQ